MEGSQLSDAKVMKPVGCERCRGLGYRGRMGIFEMFVVDDEVRHMINQRKPTMLLRQKAIVEGGLALLATTSLHADLAAHSIAEETRRRSSLLGDLLTPVAKSFPAECGVGSNTLALQNPDGSGSPQEEAGEVARSRRSSSGS